jgi:hypothetical protein
MIPPRSSLLLVEIANVICFEVQCLRVSLHIAIPVLLVY